MTATHARAGHRRGPIATFGVPVGLAYSMQRVLQALSPRLNLHVYEIMVQHVPATGPQPPGMREGLALREIPQGSPALAAFPVQPKALAFRFAQDAHCLGAYRGDELVGYLWFCRDRYAEDEVRCLYRPGPAGESIFDFDFYIFPRHRMSRAFGDMWRAFNAYLHAHGVRQTFSRVSRFNLVSRRSHAHLGARRIGVIVTFVAWRLELKFLSMKPFVHVSWSPDRMVRIDLVPP